MTLLLFRCACRASWHSRVLERLNSHEARPCVTLAFTVWSGSGDAEHSNGYVVSAGREGRLDGQAPGFSPCRCHFAHYHFARLSTVQTEAHTAPPMLNVAAACGFFTWSSLGTLPSNCCPAHPIMAMPVAPTGCPFAISPPDVLMPHSPSGLALPSTQYLAPSPGCAFPITSAPMAPMTLKQSCTSATLISAGVRPAILWAVLIARYAPAGRNTSRLPLAKGSVASPNPAISTVSCFGTPSFASPSSVARISAA